MCCRCACLINRDSKFGDSRNTALDVIMPKSFLFTIRGYRDGKYRGCAGTIKINVKLISVLY